MKYFFFTALMLLAGRSFSQTTSYPLRKWQEGKTIRYTDSSKSDRPKINLVAPGASPARMPVATVENKGVFSGNNGRRGDVFVMKRDHMPCLAPDSTFHSSLPVSGRLKEQKLGKQP